MLLPADTALDMRFLDSRDVALSLVAATTKVLAGTNPAVVQAWLDSAIRSNLNSSAYGLAKVRDSYLASLGIKNSTQPAADDTTARSEGKGQETAAVASSLVGGAACVLVVVIVLRLKHSHRKLTLFGKARAPHAGPASTLLITDIENSTGLWEGLPQVSRILGVHVHDTRVLWLGLPVCAPLAIR